LERKEFIVRCQIYLNSRKYLGKRQNSAFGLKSTITLNQGYFQGIEEVIC
jgi:hypothetical protein